MWFSNSSASFLNFCKRKGEREQWVSQMKKQEERSYEELPSCKECREHLLLNFRYHSWQRFFSGACSKVPHSFNSTLQFFVERSIVRCWVIPASFLFRFFEVPLSNWLCSELEAACEPLLFSGIQKRRNFSLRSQLISISKLSSLQLWKQNHQQTGFPSLTFIQLVLFWNTGLVLGDAEMATLALNTVILDNCAMGLSALNSWHWFLWVQKGEGLWSDANPWLAE